MRRSGLIRLSDVQPIVDLLAELADQTIGTRLDHLLSRMTSIFRARVALAAVGEAMPDGTLRNRMFRDCGMEPVDRQNLSQLLCDSRGSQLPMASFYASRIRGQDVPCTAFDRRVEYDDYTWYHSETTMEYCRAINADENLYVMSPIPGTWQAAGFALFRPWGERHAFSNPEKQMLQLLLDGTRKLLIPSAPQLPRRQQQVLDLLLSGLSVKQVAFQLEISIHTAEEHVSALYRKFNVSGCHELMARFVR